MSVGCNRQVFSIPLRDMALRFFLGTQRTRNERGAWRLERGSVLGLLVIFRSELQVLPLDPVTEAGRELSVQGRLMCIQATCGQLGSGFCLYMLPVDSREFRERANLYQAVLTEMAATPAQSGDRR